MDEPLGTLDLELFREGAHDRLYDHLGAHLVRGPEAPGVRFAVWAPNAAAVSVVGDWNGWDERVDPLAPLAASGIWSGLVPTLAEGALYKYRLIAAADGRRFDKADPFAFRAEVPPATASVVYDVTAHPWHDDAWLATRVTRNALDAPIAIYELHLGSWLPASGVPGRSPSYRELAPRLIDHLHAHGFTHVELMPVMEHPFYGSWGYQTTAYYAPSGRYGTPADFAFLIDALHRAGIGVILDWVPSHFPNDPHGLGCFDGTALFEYADPREGVHPDWNSLIFDYGRGEVRSFLLSSACFWLDRYHADGLRVDAVASMLYRDYSRRAGEWVPNRDGGRENFEAIALLRQLNTRAHERFPAVLTVAEESTAWPGVTRSPPEGGLGFDLKWDMGWTHDVLSYFRRDPRERHHHHGELTFRMMYAHSERFVVPLSHDEVVHGKRSLLERMPGDDWQQRANLRLLLGYAYMQPGKKLLFMGAELGQRREWDHDRPLDWDLLDDPRHAGVARWVRDLNALYRHTPALHELDVDARAGFAWIACDDAEHSTLCFLRCGRALDARVLVACNFTPVPREGFVVGVPLGGRWHEVLNGDASIYGGSGWGNFGGADAAPVPAHGYAHSLVLTLPPLALVAFVRG